MSYLAELHTLYSGENFSGIATWPSVESIETPSKASIDTLDTASDERFQNFHGIERGELQATAGADWPAIANNPKALEALARLIQTKRQRQRGERPAHYTQAIVCDACGPVWLWEGAPARVIFCPWCANRAQGRPIPPAPAPEVACCDCRHFQRDTINPPGGMGRCAIDSPASHHPGTLWPWPAAIHRCRDWRRIIEGERP